MPSDTAPVPPPIPAPAPRLGAPPSPSTVSLGFRDGSTTALAPGSAEARALAQLARTLTERD